MDDDTLKELGGGGYFTVQNNILAVHRHTAAELIAERANAEKDHMGMTTWEAPPDEKL